MCGIIGYSGSLPAREILLDGLSALEYRGYDSAGVALFGEAGVSVTRTVGKVRVLRDLLENAPKPAAAPTCGIGHTRWATHGGVSETNAHPHRAGHVTLVHNGIIENYRALRAELSGIGREPVSQTDSELAAMLIDSHYTGDPAAAVYTAVGRMEGSWALCILFDDRPGELYAIRRGSPLVAALTPDGAYAASDVTALCSRTRDVLLPPEDTLLILTPGSARLMDSQGAEVEPERMHVDWDTAAAQRGGFPHYMLKEIHDQPAALRDTLAPRLYDGIPNFESDGIDDGLFFGIRRVIITACGTAYHAGLAGALAIEQLARIPARAELASEVRYCDPILDTNTLVIVVSQSGETADTLAALRLAKERGARTMSIVNVKGSTIARESARVLYTHAGPEIAVASTKAFTVQLLCLYLVSIRLGMAAGTLSRRAGAELVSFLTQASMAVEEVIALDGRLEQAARSIAQAENLFFIGRGADWPMAQEGSLKLKEVSYIHSEAYAAGELKHGTISLIEPGTPVIALSTQPATREKLVSNVREVLARGAAVTLIETGDAGCPAGFPPECYIALPDIPARFASIPLACALQLLAYHTAVLRGCDVDQPRNLAKSVTVE